MLVERTFQTEVVDLNYAEGPNAGPPLVLIHGLGVCWQGFLPLLPALVMRWRVLAVDLRGHGKSGRVAGRYGAEDYVGDIEAFIRQVAGEPAALYGHSLGGVVATGLAARFPELVRALIIGDSPLYWDTYQGGAHFSSMAAMRQLARAGGQVEEVARRLGQLPVPIPGQELPGQLGDLPQYDAASLRFSAKCLLRSDPDTFTSALEGLGMDGLDASAVLPQVTCPVLLLQANPELGGLIPEEDVQRTLSHVPHVVRVRIETVGHGLHQLQVEPVQRVLLNFLESL